MTEKERQAIIQEGWLEDRLGLLTNYYITLMQAEVDRYQDTAKLLRDYYVGMEGRLQLQLVCVAGGLRGFATKGRGVGENLQRKDRLPGNYGFPPHCWSN